LVRETFCAWRRAVLRPAVYLSVQAFTLHAVVCPSLAGRISQTSNLLMRAGGPRLALRTAARVNSGLFAVARHRGAGRSSGVARADVAPVPPFRPIEMFLSLEKATCGAEMWASSGCTRTSVPAEGVTAGGRRMAGVPALRALVNVRAGGHLRERVSIACEALFASAVEPARPVHTTRVSSTLMYSGTQEALINVVLAVLSLVTRGTGALARLDADPTVLTRNRAIGLAGVAGTFEAWLAPAGVMSRRLREAGGVHVAPMVTSEAEVKRKASCVGRVEGKPKLARTRIASSLVDAPGIFRWTMMTVLAALFLALVHVITVRPVSLKALVALTSVVEDPVAARRVLVAPVGARAEVKLSTNGTTAALLGDLVGLKASQLGAVQIRHQRVALN